MNRGPQTKKDIDAVIFRRVTKRLISDRVTRKQLPKFIKQARMLLDEVIAEVTYEKEYLINPVAPTKNEVKKSLEEKITDHYAVVFERLADN